MHFVCHLQTLAYFRVMLSEAEYPHLVQVKLGSQLRDLQLLKSSFLGFWRNSSLRQETGKEKCACAVYTPSEISLRTPNMIRSQSCPL